MELKKYIDMPNSEMPDDIREKLMLANGITLTSFDDKNSILTNASLRSECGYARMESNYYLVSMYTPMPSVTPEMVAWWFWWHAQEGERYKAWYPGEHKSISFAKKDKEYFAHKNVPEFQTNTQYPVERIGKLTAPLSIKFVSPEEFGFDSKLMADNNVGHIVCGHVGAFKGLIPNTEMAHVFFNDGNGLFLVSRFWLGKNLKSRLLRRLLVTEKQARGMAEHCCIEYRNFASKIPLMYNEWHS